MYTASKDRTVWTYVVKSVYYENWITDPENIFPMESMSLLQLEHIATSPVRFATGVLKALENDETPNPVAIRILKLSSSSHPTLPFGSFKMLGLSSGGRFLLTLTDMKMLQIWDLGYSANMLIGCQPLASMIVEDILVDQGFIYSTTSNGEGHLCTVACSTPSQ